MKSRFWHGEQFLDWLNNRVRMTADGQLRVRTPREKNARDAGHPCEKEFVFTREIGIVIKGYCVLEEQAEDRRLLFITIDGLKPASVLMLATCCDVYDEKFQDALRGQFPEITWIFPAMVGLVHDFGSDEGVLEAAQCLITAGIIAHADNDS